MFENWYAFNDDAVQVAMASRSHENRLVGCVPGTPAVRAIASACRVVAAYALMHRRRAFACLLSRAVYVALLGVWLPPTLRIRRLLSHQKHLRIRPTESTKPKVAKDGSHR